MKSSIVTSFICRSIFLLAAFFLSPYTSWAQNANPAFYIANEDGGEDECNTYSGSAPVEARFQANPEDIPASATYEWRFYLDTDTTAYLVRYEENTSVTFTKAGLHRVLLYVRYKDDNGFDVEITNEDAPLTLSISESILVFPNAFSPNGDGINDIYKAKSGYQSIVEFRATIFNRWGQALYSWNSPDGGWDGTFRGKPVKDGVYFVHVTAKGADGRIYDIKKDVNLLRGFTEKITNN